jgi:hypothetical protein
LHRHSGAKAAQSADGQETPGRGSRPGKGKNHIEGPSTDLALAAARCWGNCAIEALPVQDLPGCWIFTAAFVDLETGFTLTRQFMQEKESIVYGEMDESRKATNRFSIGQSKAARNVVIKALPQFLIDGAMNCAKEGLVAKMKTWVDNKKGLPNAAAAMIGALAKHGVKEAAVLDMLGIRDRKAITLENIVVLQTCWRSLEKGEAYAEDLFPVKAQPSQTGLPPEPKKAEAKTDLPEAQLGTVAYVAVLDSAAEIRFATTEASTVNGEEAEISPEQEQMEKQDAFARLQEAVNLAPDMSTLEPILLEIRKQSGWLGDTAAFALKEAARRKRHELQGAKTEGGAA